MATGRKIRIIKQNERSALRERENLSAQTKETAPNPAHSVQTTVSAWIRDFQQQQVRDARRAFNSLFKDSGLRTA
ncbi:MAG TPA: hypothetical protein VGB17_16285 [Pyrinomonadaceae bacterium]|jgi:dsDNA-specific endonuclease/ATPase MutS2